MKVLAVGGGSGGHVTPVVAVIKALKQQDASVEVRFWCDRKFFRQARGLIAKSDPSVSVTAIISGKFRRYHGVGVWAQLADVPTVLHNIKDMFLVAIGFMQSLVQLLVWRPDVVFTKGGFVCLPVGVAARVLRIPLVIHDSDTHPGLTNRILAKWATKIATGAPLKYYPYPAAISEYIGIPVSESFHPVSRQEQQKLRQQLSIPSPDKPLVVVTGGGLGAKRINDTVVAVLNALLTRCVVFHISGAWQYEAIKRQVPQHQDYLLRDFVDSGMAEVLAAADVIVTRAGATTMLELAALAKPVIIIPNGRLTGGHQLKNAQVYAEAQAAELLDEELLMNNPQRLATAVISLLDDPKRQVTLAKALHQFAKPDAATDMARIIRQSAGKGR